MRYRIISQGQTVGHAVFVDEKEGYTIYAMFLKTEAVDRSLVLVPDYIPEPKKTKH